MTARQLVVRVNDQLVGHLREENDLWQFEYSSTWVKLPQAFDLAPALSRSQGLIVDGATNRPVQWYFDNLLPEEALRTLIAKESGLNADDAFGLLAHFGAESAGSLVLRVPGKTTLAKRGLKPLPLKELSKRIANLAKVSLTKDAPKRMSLAGAQHKMLMTLRDGELFEPLPGTASTHILKPNHPGKDYPASVMNEYFTMRLAAALELDAPRVHRMYVPQPVYIVERFDRIVPASGSIDVDTVLRRHVIDTCQLLNKARTFKYTAAHLDTLKQAIEYCRSKAAARMQLFRWLVFNILVGNGDSHLKNISFLVDESGINIAPAYDLLSTAAYDTKSLADDKGRWPHTSLALTLGDAKTFAGVTREHILDAATTIGLTRTTATRELDRMLRDAPLAAETLITEIEASIGREAKASPDPKVAGRNLAIERRLLSAIKHIVIADMCKRLRPR